MVNGAVADGLVTCIYIIPELKQCSSQVCLLACKVTFLNRKRRIAHAEQCLTKPAEPFPGLGGLAHMLSPLISCSPISAICTPDCNNSTHKNGSMSHCRLCSSRCAACRCHRKVQQQQPFVKADTGECIVPAIDCNWLATAK